MISSLKTKKHLILCFCLCAIIPIFSCYSKKKQLIIYVSDNLAPAMRDITPDFEKLLPSVNIIAEVSPNFVAVRKLQLNNKVDILMLADFETFENLLLPDEDKIENKEGYVDSYFGFAIDSMVIAFTDKSKYANEIYKDNWHNVLLRKDVKLGIVDQKMDPCGYRTNFVLQLSDIYYKQKISKQILNKCNSENIRPSIGDLLPQLESLDLDYIFLYKSIAEEHNLRYIELPENINLGNPALNDYYSNVRLNIVYGELTDWYFTDKFNSRKVPTPVYGKNIVYAIGMLRKSENKEIASKFINFIFSNRAKRILNKHYLLPDKDIKTVQTQNRKS